MNSGATIRSCASRRPASRRRRRSDQRNGRRGGGGPARDHGFPGRRRYFRSGGPGTRRGADRRHSAGESGPAAAEIAADRRTEIFRKMPGEEASTRLVLLPREARQELEQSLSYAPDTAGGVMTTEFSAPARSGRWRRAWKRCGPARRRWRRFTPSISSTPRASWSRRSRCANW